MILGLLAATRGAWRNNWKRALAAIAVVIAFDLVEGVVVAALLGVRIGWMGAHPGLTPGPNPAE